MKKLFTLIAISLMATAVVSAQPQSYHTSLFDKIDPDTGRDGRYSALWGYTAPDGREYAIVGGFRGTHIVDVTEKPIREVAFIPGNQSGWREMKTYGTYAYVVSEGGGGLQIINLANLPKSATLFKSDTSIFRTGHTISQEGHYLYVHGTKAEAAANGGTLIFDLLPDPLNPRLIAKYTARYVHDAVIYNDTMYASAVNAGQLDIVYLGEDHTNPQLITSIVYPFAGTHNADLTADHRYVMTTDEINQTPKTLKVWDIADLNNITKVADWTPAPGEVIHNVHRKGNLAYIAWYTAGTRIVDMSDPRDPAEVGYFDTYQGANGGYSGNWGTYPYFASGKIISSDMQTGLYVFTFDGSRRGKISGVVRDSATGAPIPSARVEITELGRTIVADDSGRYSFAGALDTLEFSASAENYYLKLGSLQLGLADGARPGSFFDIVLKQMPIAQFSIRAFDSASGEEIPNIAYTLKERSVYRANAATPVVFTLPKDSIYHFFIGAWGYRPLRLDVNNVGREYKVSLNRGYIDNVELDLGWILSDTSDRAGGGFWERGEPVLTFSNGMVIQPGNQTTIDGRNAFFTGLINSNANGAGSNDVDDGHVSLTSPRFDLADSSDPWINCSIWYSRDGFATSINDTLDVLLSGDDGATWVRVDSITTSPQQWVRYSYQVKNAIMPTDSMRFRVVASDLRDQSLVEAGLDDFVISSGGPGALKEDTLVIRDTGAVASVSDRSLASQGVRVQILPNPVVDRGYIIVGIDEAQADARLELFDARGERVAILFHGGMAEGEKSFSIDGASLRAGSYRWRLLLDDGSMATGMVNVVR